MQQQHEIDAFARAVQSMQQAQQAHVQGNEADVNTHVTQALLELLDTIGLDVQALASNAMTLSLGGEL